MRTQFWVAVAAWVGVAIGHLFWSWLVTWLWLFALLVVGVLWVTALWATAAVVGVARRRGKRTAVAAGLAAAIVATAVVLVDWTDAFARGWFRVHRGEFATAAHLARSGALGPPGEWEYYGVELPIGLRVLSVDGRISTIGTAGGAPVLFVPAYEGIPDDAYGFVHVVGPVDGGVSTATETRSCRASRWETGGGGPTSARSGRLSRAE